jgi:hypothetical protein
MSAMNEQLQQLARSAGRPDVSLQILASDEPGTVRGELFTISRFGPDGNVALQDMMSTGCPGKDFSLGDGKETCLRLIACRMPVMTSLDSDCCKEPTPKIAESHWPGGQCEP